MDGHDFGSKLLRFRRFGGAVAVRDFALDVVDHLWREVGVEFGAHAAQGYADDVAVMEFGSQTLGGQLQPEAVGELDVLGPEPGRMGTEVEKHRVLAVLEHDLE
jgi:hypothetical protein